MSSRRGVDPLVVELLSPVLRKKISVKMCDRKTSFKFLRESNQAEESRRIKKLVK